MCRRMKNKIKYGVPQGNILGSITSAIPYFIYCKYKSLANF